MARSQKPAKTQVSLDPEVDAALQLIHLSGGEDSSADNHGGGASNGINHEISSRGMTVEDGNLDDQDFPPKNRKFRLLSDIYSKTVPILSKKRGGSAAAAAGKKKKIR